MTFEELLKNPERYRCGENYKATNIVFPVEIEGSKYIVKKPQTGLLSSLIQKYYKFQDNLFYGNRTGNSPEEGIRRDITVLEKLDGLNCPQLRYFDFQKPILIRDYLEGNDFRSLSDKNDILQTLEGALEAMMEIHEKDVFIGDAHVKNTFLSKSGDVYWLDFDGEFDDSDIVQSKAIDLLTFVYSTFTATRDESLILHSVDMVLRKYHDKEVRNELKEIVSSLPSKGFRLWFPTRLPREGDLHRVVRNKLSLRMS